MDDGDADSRFGDEVAAVAASPSPGGEPTILDYARFYGLASDHRLATIPLPPPPLLERTSPEEEKDEDEDNLRLLVKEKNEHRERLSVDRRALVLLTQVTSSSPAPLRTPARHLDPLRARKLKVEPLLWPRGQEEFDLEAVRRKREKLVDLDLRDELHLHLPKRAEETDEELEWPPPSILEAVVARTSSEKLKFEKSTVAFLQDVISPSTLSEEERRSTQNDKSNAFIWDKALDEEISQLSLVVTPSESTNEDNRNIPTLPAHVDFLHQRELDAPNKKHHRTTPPRPASAPASLFPLHTELVTNFSESKNNEKEHELDSKFTPIKRAKSEDLLLGTLSTPPATIVSLEKAAKNPFQEQLPAPISHFRQPIARKDESESSEGEVVLISDTDKHTEKIVHWENPRALVPGKVFVHSLDSEEAGTEDSQSSAPFKRDDNPLSLLETLQNDSQHQHLLTTCSPSDKALWWAPFSEQALSVAVEDENIPKDDDLLHTWFADSTASERQKPELTLQKSDVFKVLEADDQEIEPANFSEKSPLELLLKKRKQVIEDLQDEAQTIQVQKKQKGRETPSADHSDSESSPGNFNVHQSLNDFLSLRTGIRNVETKLKGKVGPNSESSLVVAVAAAVPQRKEHVAEVPPVITQPATEFMQYGAKAPKVKLPSGMVPYVVSMWFMSGRRSLMRLVRELYPNAALIERDFLLHEAAPFLRNRRFPGYDPTREADIIVNRNTGIMVTSLQQLNIRHMPQRNAGPGRSSPYEKIFMATAPRYANVSVLVSQNLPPAAAGTSVGLSSWDIESLNSLQRVMHSYTYAEFFRIKSYIIYAPGGERTLAEWIVYLMITLGKNRVANGYRYPLMSDETEDEVCMRLVGFNAYAAQLINRLHVEGFELDPRLQGIEDWRFQEPDSDDSDDSDGDLPLMILRHLERDRRQLGDLFPEGPMILPLLTHRGVLQIERSSSSSNNNNNNRRGRAGQQPPPQPRPRPSSAERRPSGVQQPPPRPLPSSVERSPSGVQSQAHIQGRSGEQERSGTQGRLGGAQAQSGAQARRRVRPRSRPQPRPESFLRSPAEHEDSSDEDEDLNNMVDTLVQRYSNNNDNRDSAAVQPQPEPQAQAIPTTPARAEPQPPQEEAPPPSPTLSHDQPDHHTSPEPAPAPAPEPAAPSPSPDPHQPPGPEDATSSPPSSPAEDDPDLDQTPKRFKILRAMYLFRPWEERVELFGEWLGCDALLARVDAMIKESAKISSWRPVAE